MHIPSRLLRGFNNGLFSALCCSSFTSCKRSKADSTSLHPSFYDSTIERFARQTLEEITLDKLLYWGRLAQNDDDAVIQSARNVQLELPKRLARRLLDLQLLPYLVVTNPHIKLVYDGYRKSFDELRSFPLVETHGDNVAFKNLLRRNLDSHAAMLDRLATGLKECKSKELVGPLLQLDSFFDNMLHSRISRRVIAEQHLHLNSRRQGFVGIVQTNLNVHEAAEFAAQKTCQICTETFGVAPEISIIGGTVAGLPYIPAHLDYILFELLKNAARATVESQRGRPRLPPIQVKICDGISDLAIRISDQGGGVPSHFVQHIWSYGFSTVGMDEKEMRRWFHRFDLDGARSVSVKKQHSSGLSFEDESFSQEANAAMLTDAAEDILWKQQQGDVSGYEADANDQHVSKTILQTGISESGSLGRRSQMAGLGFGLPLSRLYARYFGGDLKLNFIPGYGTDAYLTLKRLGDLESE